MFRTLWSYLRTQVGPRAGDLFTEPEIWLSVAIGIAAALGGWCLPIADSDAGDVAALVIAYAAVAFGFSLAGLTFALTPGKEFKAKIASLPTDPRGKRKKRREHRRESPGQSNAEREHQREHDRRLVHNAYSDLLFVFSWTALAHWIVIVLGFATVVGRGYDEELLPRYASVPTHVLFGLLAASLAYAVMQFLVTVITLSQVGRAYVDTLLEDPQDESDSAGV